MVGPGVAVFDYDGDGALDILLLQGDLIEPGKTMKDATFKPPAGWKPGARLFRNKIKQTGKLEFEDVTEKANIDFRGQGMGVAVGDYDNDGFPDLCLTSFNKNVLLHNNGHGAFTDVSKEAGLDDTLWGTSATFFDYDKDGWLDLCIVHYVNYSVKSNVKCFSPSGELDYCGPKAYQGTTASLFHNLGERNGKVTFKEVTDASGIGSKAGPGLGVVAADFNGDGWPDLLISNDGEMNHLWINQRNGKFTESALEAGIGLDANGKSQANMGLAVEDIDNDGLIDVLVTHLPEEGAVLYHNKGAGQFNDDTAKFRLLQATRGTTGFGTEWLDYDNDGKIDLFIANGAVRVREDQRGKTPYPFLEKNQLFHNEGGGVFKDVSNEAGPAFQIQQVGRGLATGDLDNDGGLDVVVSVNNGRPLIYRNLAARGKRWIGIKLIGKKSNRDGIGSVVTLVSNGREKQSRRVHTDGSYCSASDAVVHFGLGENGATQTVEIAWLSGLKERFENLPADRVSRVEEGSGTKL